MIGNPMYKLVASCAAVAVTTIVSAIGPLALLDNAFDR
jgi:hypothetical protein